MSETSYLSEIEIDNSDLPAVDPEIEQERRVAIYDLLQGSKFAVPARGARKAPPGPYKLLLGMREGRILFAISTASGAKVADFHMSLAPFRQVIKDYFAIRDSYFDAVKKLPIDRIETIDMARQGIHNEAARLLTERLDGKILVDHETARRLFTLICAMQVTR